MPVSVPQGLPAEKQLKKDGLLLSTEKEGRALKVLVLNLMPTKLETELQLARLLGRTPLPVKMELLGVHRMPRHTSAVHMQRFYQSFEAVEEQYYDGLILTGTPVERMPFEQVEYWPELCRILRWSITHAGSTMHICWSAQAGLYYHYGIEKQVLPQKLSGIFSHTVCAPENPLMAGFDDVFTAPHSRYSAVETAGIRAVPELEILAESREAGVYAIWVQKRRQLFVLGHPEYDRDSLQKEYLRDLTADRGLRPPEHCFKEGDLNHPLPCTWRSGATLLFANWLGVLAEKIYPALSR